MGSHVYFAGISKIRDYLQSIAMVMRFVLKYRKIPFISPGPI